MITLYTASTPNGQKASIALEELGIEYSAQRIDLGKLEQKTPEFLSMNPNGRIPVIVDHDNNDFTVFESGAILMYLAEKTGKLLPTSFNERSEVIQWLMFQMGGIGPMMGQANVFYRYAEEKIPYAIERYQKESRRLLEVLNLRLMEHEFICDDYSIADIANFTWARIYDWSGVDTEDLSHLHRWLKTIESRPAVQRGLAVPADPQSDKSDEAKVDSIKKMVL